MLEIGGKCPICGVGSMRKVLIDETLEYRGLKAIVRDVRVFECDVCDEGVFYSKKDTERLDHEFNKLRAEYALRSEKFPLITACPRWYGKSIAWYSPREGIVRLRFTEWDAMDRICSLIEKAGRRTRLKDHKPPYRWEVDVFVGDDDSGSWRWRGVDL